MPNLRIASDTGGTFTDLVVEDDGQILLFKASTTPQDPVLGVLDAVDLAAAHYATDRRELLSRTSMFIHGTTRAINAIITGKTARTAFLTTRGHRDILTIREGGRIEPFNFRVDYPQPYVPRRYTFEVGERISASGQVLIQLDEKTLIATIERLKKLEIEAVGVCLLWSVANPVHELRIGELLAEHLPGMPFTLSHQLNPTLREYRRASSTVIDASLKPLMFEYLNGLEARLRQSGFNGRALVVTSSGGVMDAAGVANAPIYSINSGPAMAPVAGRFYAGREFGNAFAIIADTGGTTFDVSLVRDGKLPWTRETWIGQKHRGHMTGFPSVDIKSIGAGGGSIAWIDSGRMLHVGPQSAGSTPGPVAYGRGGEEPTVTDCALILGYIDPDYFLGGAMKLDRAAAVRQLQEKVASPLDLSVEDAALAVIGLSSEKMIAAIEEITINQGIDPAQAVLIGGGGAAGLNIVALGKRLQCAGVMIPEAGAVLSAAGALMSDLSTDHAILKFTTDTAFKHDEVNEVLEQLEARCKTFLAAQTENAIDHRIEFSVEARYPNQIWEIDVPISTTRIASQADLSLLCAAFHEAHKRIFEIEDPDSPVEFVTWRAKVSSQLKAGPESRLASVARVRGEGVARRAYFADAGWVDTPVHRLETMASGKPVPGPAMIESSYTTVVVDAGAVARRTEAGAICVEILKEVSL